MPLDGCSQYSRRPLGVDSTAQLPKELSEPLAVESSMLSADATAGSGKHMSPTPNPGALADEDDVASDVSSRDKV